MLKLQDFGEATFEVLRAALVALLQDGCGGFGKDAEKIYLNAAWIRSEKLRLRGDVIKVCKVRRGIDR